MPGTGSSGLESAVANVVQDGDAVLCVVTGYFGDRLAQVCERYGANVTRLTGEWGRAIDPEQVRTALQHASFKAVTIVHAETSTGVLQPVQAVAALAREHGARIIVDAVTSLGAHPVDVDGWGLDVVYSCSQKGLGAPSGFAPIAFNAADARGCPEPQLLPGPATARGLLDQARLSPHDLHAARLRAVRSACA